MIKKKRKNEQPKENTLVRVLYMKMYERKKRVGGIMNFEFL